MSGHVAPKSMYYAVFAALIFGTALTVAVAFVDLGAMNNVLMLGIAMTKALRDLGLAGGKVKMIGFDAGSQSVVDMKNDWKRIFPFE